MKSIKWCLALLSSAMISTGGWAAVAAYDSALKAPKCGGFGASCEAGPSLLNGRATIYGGIEPNRPNTIGPSCLDGTSGSYHSDESIDAVRVVASTVSTTNPTLQGGKSARIEADVWAYSAYSLDFLDFFSAADANAPSWTYLGTVKATKAGFQTLSKEFVLPNGSLQAVRAQFRYGAVTGTPGACVNGSYNDRDDVVFAAVSDIPVLLPSPVVTVSSYSQTQVRLSWGAVPGATGYRIDASTSPLFDGTLPDYSNKDLGNVTNVYPAVVPGTTYFYRVRAYDSTSTSVPSKTVSYAAPPLPDLRVSQLSIPKLYLKPGDPLNLVMGLINSGAGSTVSPPAFSVLDNGGTIWSGGVQALASSQEIILTPGPLYVGNTEGIHQLVGSVNVGASPLILESNYANNTTTITYTLDGHPPVLAIMSPTANAVVSGTVDITATWSDNFGQILGNNVDLFVDGVLNQTRVSPMPEAHFTWVSTSVADGTHLLFVQALDLAGNIGISSVTVTVQNSPTNGAKLISAGSLPSQVIQRSAFNASVTMQNTGASTWEMGPMVPPTATLRLASQNPLDNLLWGSSSFKTQAPVPVGMNGEFFLSLVAPSTPGVYPIQWRMTEGSTPFGDYAFNSTITVVQDTLSPTGPVLKLLDVSTASLTVGWTQGTDNVGVSGYLFDVSTSNLFTTFVPGYHDFPVSYGPISLVLKGLALDTLYYVRARAVDVNGLMSGYSASLSMRTLLTPDTTPPSLVVSAPTPNAMVSWYTNVYGTVTDNAGIKFLGLYVDGVSQLQTTPTSRGSYTFSWNSRNSPNGIHTLMVKASDFAGNISTVSFPVNVFYETVPPTAPTLTVPVASSTTLTLAWSGATDNGLVAAYQLDVSSVPGFVPMLSGYSNRNVGNVSSFTVTGLAPSSVYYARVRAIDLSGNISPNSPTISGTTLGSTSSFKVGGGSGASLADDPLDPIGPFGLRNAYIYPNPLRAEGGNLRVITGLADRVSARVVTIDGHVVWEVTLDGAPNVGGFYEAPVSAAEFQTGVYLLFVESEKDGQTQTVSRKIAVVK